MRNNLVEQTVFLLNNILTAPLHCMNRRYFNEDAMTDSSPLVHPDVSGTKRYVMGTKMQMRKTGTSHKLPECSYHDLSCAKQGVHVSTMSQEGLQMTR